MRSEKEKMLSGELYNAADDTLDKERKRARDLFYKFNQTTEDERDLRKKIMYDLLGKAGEGLSIEPPFYCDYGYNIFVGDKVFFNFNCIILDVMKVTIGSDVLFGPGVQINTATHPMDWKIREKLQEFAMPVTIGSNVWVGSGSIICPGVTIGNRTVIGAGSIVTRDIPADVLAVGNPCRVIRELDK
jgi:maltose O-acetyltransferase